MVKLMFCMRRLPHFTRDEFQRYWRDEHPKAALPNALSALGIRRYVQVFALSEEVNAELRDIRDGEEEFDGVAEIWLDGPEDYQQRWTSGTGLEAFRSFLDDEANFVDWSRSVFFLGEESTVVE